MDYVQLTMWAIVFAVALYILIKGADLFIAGAETLGRAFGLSAFAVGVFIVGFGTSIPELASSIAGVLEGTTELVAANVVGSNITNILLIIGAMAVLAGRVIINQDILKTELPLFVISQAIMVAVIIDGAVTRVEAGFLLAIFVAYVWYVLVEAKSGEPEPVEDRPKVTPLVIGMMLLGLVGVLVGAKFTVDMAVNIATALAVPIGLVSITAIAIGTSLPELFVSVRAVLRQKTELAIGNIFGSNTFNALVVLGIPTLITPLLVDNVVLDLGIWYLGAASLMIFVIGLSRQVMRWEGLMMLMFFVFFLTKLAVFL